MPASSVIQLRRGTAAQWTSANPTLANGEPGYETDTGKEKRGDGTTAWASLAYFAPGTGTFAPLASPALTGTPTINGVGIARLRHRPKVALLGDSITNQNGDISSATAPLTGAKGYFTWANVLLNGVIAEVYNTSTDDEFGTSGQTTADILNDTLAGDDLTAAVNADADVVIVHAGTNDVGAGTSAATIAGNLQSIWNTLIARGKLVIATTILPRAYPSDTTAEKQALLDANRLIRANAKATRNVILCDWYGALLDPSTGLAKTSFLADAQIHPNAIGASRMGTVLAGVIGGLFPSSTTPELSMSTVDTANLLAANGLMVGTSGSVSGAALSGSVATGWTIFQDGSPTSVVASKVARTDLAPGEWQQIVYTAATPGSDGAHAQWQDTGVGTNWNVGDTIRAAVEFQTDAAGWDCRSMQLVVFFFGNGGSTTGLQASSSDITGLSAAINRPSSGVITTPACVIPTGTTRLQVQLTFRGSGTIRYGRAHLLKNV